MSQRIFYHQFCLCRDFLVPPANFLCCSHITRAHQNFSLPSFPWNTLHLHYPQALLEACLDFRVDQMWLISRKDTQKRWGRSLGYYNPTVKPNKAGEWCWAWLVHQQFNLLKADSRSVNNFQFDWNFISWYTAVGGGGLHTIFYPEVEYFSKTWAKLLLIIMN